MGLEHKTANAAQPWRIVLALLCVLLVVVGCTVQVAHSHADGTANHADCSLCVAAHVGMQVSVAPATAPVATAVATAVELAPATVPPSSIYPFALFNRPPPASVSPA